MTSPPVKYVRQANYTDFTTQHPTDQQSGTSLDADFGAVLTSNNQIIDRLAQIQRADGALFNAIVTPDSLSKTTLALFVASGGGARGAWLTTTAYAVKDIVTQGGLTYICLTAHTAGVFATDLAAAKWLLLPFNPAPFTLDALNGLVGINISPVNVLDIALNGNAAAIGQIFNNSAGGAARADFRATNGTNTVQLAMLGTGFTTVGALIAGRAILTTDAAAGLLILTSVNQPVSIGQNGNVVATFNSNSTIGGSILFGVHGLQAAVGNGLAGGGIDFVDLPTNTSGGGFPGILIVSNISQADGNIRTQTIYAVTGRGTTLATTQLATVSSGGGTPFTLSCPSNGVIRMTNTYAGLTTGEMAYFGIKAS